MKLQEVDKIFEDILKTRCDELLVDRTDPLYRNAGMLREIHWRYKSYIFWVEYMYFEAPGGQTNNLLKDVVIPLKLRFKADGEEQWAGCNLIEEFLDFLF